MQTGSSSKQSQYRYETGDINGRSIIWTAVMLVVILIFIGFILFGLLAYFGSRQPVAVDHGQGVTEKKQIPPLPHLEVKPGISSKELRQEKESLLHSYGWINKEKGIVHIPIEHAMKLLIVRKALGYSENPHD
jgi:hypothetical protein